MQKAANLADAARHRQRARRAQRILQPGQPIADRCDLLDRLGRSKSDMMGCLVKGYPDANAATRARLIAKAKPDSPEGRVLLYICPECGDVGCGAYAARIRRAGARVVWTDFARESAGETFRIGTPVPFVFDARAYTDVITEATAHFSASGRVRRSK